MKARLAASLQKCKGPAVGRWLKKAKLRYLPARKKLTPQEIKETELIEKGEA